MDKGLDIDAQTWSRVSPLLDQALDLQPQQRAAWLDALPPPEDELKGLLRDLLARAGCVETDALLAELPKFDAVDDNGNPANADQDGTPGTHATGDTVGPYRLVRELGVGGMGVVWLASRADGLMQRSVALKLPHGPFRGDLAARIAREREIIATLDHPHIARLYDAGVAADGQPFLALEHVDGQPIDRYCDERHLGVAARLRLFVQAANAVAHAHAQLVVHRDIKPSNLLVDAHGQVKLLDFGIAKLLAEGLSDAPDLTQQGIRALTPDYASPEQIAGLAVGTRSDVYSLGVLLFELLTGSRPYRLKRNSRAALEEAILAAEAPRPSDAVSEPALRRALRGDLDTIVLKALNKPVDERYASVEALVADVHRHLNHQPVLARPDSAAYRLRRFLRRRRAAVGAWAAVTIALLAGTGLALWQAKEAEQQRDAALQAKQQAERERSSAQRAERAATAQAELSGFLMMEMAPSRSNNELALLLDRARRMFDAQYRDDPALRGSVLVSMGSLLNGRGDITRAHALWAEAEPLLRDNAQWSALAELQCSRATELARDGLLNEAKAKIAESKRLLARDGAPSSNTHLHCLTDEAVVERTAGNASRAATLLQQALDGERRAGRERRADFVQLLNTLARSHSDAGHYREAVHATREAADLIGQLGLERTGHLATSRALEAIAMRDGGQPLAALALLQARREVDGKARLSERVQHATTLLRLQRFDDLMPLLDGLLIESRAQDASSATRAVRLLQVQTLADSGRWQEARVPLADAQALFASLRRERRYAARVLAFTQAHWALVAGDVEQAQLAVEEARVIVAATAQPDDPAWHRVHQLQARVHLAQGRASEALTEASNALVRSQRQAVDPDASLQVAEDLLLSALSRHGLGDFDAARANALAAQRHVEAAAGINHPLAGHAKALALR